MTAAVSTPPNEGFMYLSPKSMAKFLSATLPCRRPVFVHGAPGLGKSDIIAQVLDSKNKLVFDFRASNHDPSDVRFPLIENGKIKWVNSIFPDDPNWDGGIVLEELTQAPPLMQASLLEFTLNRRIGAYKAPEKAWIVACGNRQGDKAGTHRLITPLANRFVHVGLLSDPAQWLEWAVPAGIHAAIRDYIRNNPHELDKFDPTMLAFPSPRSWAYLSDVLPAVIDDDELLLPAAAGCIGEGHVGPFDAYLKHYKLLPNLDDLLAKPMTTVVPEEPDVLYALTAALTDKARTDDKTHQSITKFGTRMPGEFTTLLFRDCEAVSKGKFLQAARNPLAVKWVQDNRENFKSA